MALSGSPVPVLQHLSDGRPLGKVMVICELLEFGRAYGSQPEAPATAIYGHGEIEGPLHLVEALQTGNRIDSAEGRTT